MTDFVIPFLWGLVVLSGFIGWGLAAARLSGAPEPDWGLSAGWGMALVLALGGVLALAGVAFAPVLVAVVAVGAVLHFVWAWKGRASGGSGNGPGDEDGLSKGAWLVLGFVALALASRYISTVWFQGANCSDDDVAYFTYVSRLLQTGTLIEPYSLRRLAGYGGQTFLQGLVMALGSEDNGFLMDRGVAVVVSFGLVVGLFPGRGGRDPLPYLLALLFTVILPFPLSNSSSHMTGFVMLLTLFRTLDAMVLSAPPSPPSSPAPPSSPGARRLWLAGAVVAAAASLKAPFMVAAVLTVLFYWLVSAFYARADGRAFLKAHVPSLLHLGASALVFLAPWMALMQRSSGTVLFPLFPGNQRPGFSDTYSGALEPGALLDHLGGFFLLPSVALLIVPVFLYAYRRGPAAGLGLYLAAIVTAVATTATLTFDVFKDLYRFAMPLLTAALIVSVVHYLNHIRRELSAKGAGGGKGGDGLLYVLVLVLIPVSVYHDAERIQGSFAGTVMTSERRAAYAVMQAAVPEGERLLAVLDQPFALNYRRNGIFNIDVPGAVSPDPGMPFFRGPGALKDYLLGQSIAYIAFRDFEVRGGCLYRRDLWNYHARGDNPMWRRQSKFYLNLMDNVQALARTEKTLYRAGGLRVIKLR